MRDVRFRWLVLTAALVALTWPMSVAHAALGYIFIRPEVADAAAVLAFPVSAVIAGVAAAVSLRRPSLDPVAWVFRCALSGALVGDIWLACGAYVQAHRSAEVLWGTMLGGLLYGAPVGLVIGMALGAEMLVLHHWAERSGGRLLGWPFVIIAVLVNFICGVGVWYGARATKTYLGWTASGPRANSSLGRSLGTPVRTVT